MNLKQIRLDVNRGRIQIEDIKALVDACERYEKTLGYLAEQGIATAYEVLEDNR